MKNKIFLGLILGIFLIGLVSASITGYLVRGKTLNTDGYTTTLQKVTDGVATIAVKTPEGDTELVRVAEGEIAKVGDAEISASSLTRGNLFTRGKGEISVNVKSDSGTGASVGVVGTHTHLTDFYTETLDFDVVKYAQLPNLSQSFSVLTSNPTNPNSYASSSHMMFSTIRVKEVNAMVYCKDGDIALGGGYFVNKKYPNDQTLGIQSHIYRAQTIQNQNLNTGGYSFDFREPWDEYYDGQNHFDENGIIQGTISVNCARIEPTLHQFGQDY